jgi:hypothetical protein
MISPGYLTVRRGAVVGAVALSAALTLAACSGSSSGASPGSPASSSSGGSGGSNGGGSGSGGGNGAANRPGASGQVAAIAGTTMQVQSQQSGQVAVSWTSSTTFSHPVSTTTSAIKAGDCVVATAASGSSDASFTATSVTVSAAANGQCGGPGGAGTGQRPSGFPSGQRPSGFPSGQRPSGVPSGAPNRQGGFATGTVSSVSGSTIVIAARQFGGTNSTTNRNVTVNSQTKVTTQQSTTASALKVGLCVSAEGKADSTGAVAATSVRISDPVDGQCTAGFGRGGGNNG